MQRPIEIIENTLKELFLESAGIEVDEDDAAEIIKDLNAAGYEIVERK